jgi:hypothetical protein
VFYDPVQREVETQFVPWLLSEMGSELDRVNAARKVVDGKRLAPTHSYNLSYSTKSTREIKDTTSCFCSASERGS